jgi:hypothetical protein
VNEMQGPGGYSVVFDAFKLSSGMYMYTLSSGYFAPISSPISCPGSPSSQKVAGDSSPAIKKDTTAATSPYMNVL